MIDRKTVRVYVRAPDDNSRTISFPRIPEVSSGDALAHEYAVDGNSYTLGVTAYFRQDEHRSVTLHEALADAQRDLVDWFGGLGLAVEFA
jgi:hypothetical protein